MRAIVIPLGSWGDVNPLLGIARTLARRGHEVVVAANLHFKEAALADGNVCYHPIGSDEAYREFTSAIDPDRPNTLVRVLTDHLLLKPIAPVYRAVETLINGRADETVLIAPPTAIGARLASEQFRLPLISIHVAPWGFRSIEPPPGGGPSSTVGSWPTWLRRLHLWTLDILMDGMIRKPINQFRVDDVGLAPLGRRCMAWLASPHKELGLFPEWLVERPSDWPDHAECTGFVSYEATTALQRTCTPELEAFLKAGPAPVVFTLGTPVTDDLAFYQMATQTCTQLGLRGVLVTPWQGQIPKQLPKTVHHTPFAGFSQLFPRSAAVVHHGGIGTCAGGLAAAVPQLLVPWGVDQFDNADQLVALGVARKVPRRRCTQAAIMEALDDLTGTSPAAEEVRLRCRELAARLEIEDGAVRACEAIEAVFEELGGTSDVF